MPRIACLIVTLSACTDEPLSLADLRDKTLHVFATSERVEIKVSHAACGVLETDVVATVNGAPMRTVSLGEESGDFGCAEPTFDLENPSPVASASIVVEDPSLRIEVPIGDHLLPGVATLVPDGPWTFSYGQEVTVSWSPAPDLEKNIPTVSLGDRNLPVAVAGDRITFTMPSEPGFASQLKFWIAGPAMNTTFTCGAAPCRFFMPRSFEHQFTLTP